MGREQELHQKVLAFSISHDHEVVRIYGHYAVIQQHSTCFYRHTLSNFPFQNPHGPERWKAYQFTKSVYFDFMPKSHTLICSAIDELPLNPVTQDPQLSHQDVFSDATGMKLSSEQLGHDAAASLFVLWNTSSPKRKRLTATAVLKEQLANPDEESDALGILLVEIERQWKDKQREMKELKEEIQRIQSLFEQMLPLQSDSVCL